MANRDDKLDELGKWLIVEPSLLPDTLWLSGRQSSGKTYLVRKLQSCIDKLNFVVILKNCSAFASVKELVQDIYCEITQTESTKLSLAEIFDLLKERRKFLLILDHCESLLDEKSSQLLSLPELTDQSVSLVIVSRCQPYYFLQPSQTIPVHIHLDMYTQDECVKIITSDFADEDIDGNVLNYYIQSMVGLVYLYNPDLFLMRKLVHKHIRTFLRPIHDGSCAIRDVRRLWTLFEPTVVTKALSSDASGGSSLTCLDPYPRDGVIEDTLPYDSNFIVVAAYMASYNPPTSDTRFFVKQRMSKKPSNAKLNVNKMNHVMGPKAFVLERLLAIFYAIHEEPERCVLANLFSQISSLVSKNYLVRHGAEMLDQPKYMCIAKYEFVAKCAKQIQFDLNEHLYDFAVGSCSNV